jgi:uncharacterized membrane protein
MVLSRQTIRILPFLVALLLFAFLARLWDINRESFWADEGWTMLLAAGPTPAEVVHTMVEDQHPPLYFVLARAAMDAFGNSATAIRMLSLFWSLVGVACAYRLAADHFGTVGGLMGGILLALQDNDILLGREARQYAQMAALALLCTLFYLRYARRPGRQTGIIWFAASVALLYTHYLGALLLALQGLHALFMVRPMRRTIDVILRLGFAGLAWAPWFLVLLSQLSWRYTRPMIFQSNLPNTPETFAIIRGDVLGSHYGLALVLALFGLGYMAYAAGKPIWRWRPVSPAFMLALWAAVPTALIIFTNPQVRLLTPQNFLFVTAPVVLLIGHGIANLDQTARRLIFTVLVVLGLFTIDAYKVKPPYREIAANMLALRADNEPILMDIWVDDMALRYHLGQLLHAEPEALPLLSMPSLRESFGEGFYPYLLEYLRDKPSFWLVYWGDPQSGFLQFFQDRGYTRTLTLTARHQGNDIYTYYYQRYATQPLAQFGDLATLEQANLAFFPAQPARSTQGLRALVEGNQIPATGRHIRVNLLWKALNNTPLDFSISAFLLRPEGGTVNIDQPPLSGSTLNWQPNGLYFDSKKIPVPPDLPPGTYQVGIKIYWYQDPKPLIVNGADYFIAGTVEVGQ